jgi:hypothetical protein
MNALPGDASGEYYMEYGLFVFPAYSRTTCFQSNGRLTGAFWQTVKRIAEHPNRMHAVSFEDPYLEDSENAAVSALQYSYPGISPGWYYCPAI